MKEENEVFSGDSSEIAKRIFEHEKELDEFCHQLYLESAYEWYLEENIDDNPLFFEVWVEIEEEKNYKR